MPMKGEAKRAYQRAWVRKKRATLHGVRGGRGRDGVKRGVGGEGGRTLSNPVEPTKSKSPPAPMRSFGAVVYTLRRQVAMLERELLGVRLFSQEAKESLESQVMVLRQRVMMLESEHALRGAQEAYVHGDKPSPS